MRIEDSTVPTATDPGSGPLVADLDPTPVRQEIHIPFITFCKIFAAILIAAATYRLWPLLLLVFLAILLAVTLNSMVLWWMTKGIKRRGSVAIVLFTVFGIFLLGGARFLPTVIEQVGTFSEHLPDLRDHLLAQLTPGTLIHQGLTKALEGPAWTNLDTWFSRFMTAGGIAFTGVTQVLLLIMIALYLVIDGGRTYRWILAFFPPFTRRKIHHTSEEISKVIFSYVVGQAITSALVMIFTFSVLSLLGVPGALMLAIMAAIFDVLPMLGFFLLTVPAFLMALSVSLKTALIVLALYVLYAALESYFIVPKVYGKSLRLSTLSVLLGLLVGTLLAGVPGALAALPLVASYSVIERIWLKHYLGEGVAAKQALRELVGRL